jgi:hypothetical protein
MNRDNFMKDHWGRTVALDYGASCFLPPSFFNFALHEGDDFTQLIARLIKPLLALFSFLCLTFPCKETDFNVLLSYPAGAQVQGQLDMAHKPSPFWPFFPVLWLSSPYFVLPFLISLLVFLICVPIVATS